MQDPNRHERIRVVQTEEPNGLTYLRFGRAGVEKRENLERSVCSSAAEAYDEINKRNSHLRTLSWTGHIDLDYRVETDDHDIHLKSS